MATRKIKNQLGYMLPFFFNPNPITPLRFQLGFTPDVVEVDYTLGGHGNTLVAKAIWTDLIRSTDGILLAFFGQPGSGEKMQYPVDPSKVNGGTAKFQEVGVQVVGTTQALLASTSNAALCYMHLNFIEYVR